MIDEEKLYKEIGTKLAKARKRKKVLTQTELGKRLGKTRTTISNIERGEQYAPLSLIYSYCELVGLDITDVLPQVNQIQFQVTSGSTVEVDGVSRVVPEKVASFMKVLENKSS